MDELMRKNETLGQKNDKPAKRDLTCSVHFVKYMKSPGIEINNSISN